MYLRHSVRRKNGKSHVYWRLVRSVRRNGKVVQETVAQLGELDAQGRARAKAMARQITGRAEQPGLFEAPPGPAAEAKVRLDRIRLERGRSFGDVWLAWTLWQALKLDTLCEGCLPRGREEVPWSVMAAVLNRPGFAGGSISWEDGAMAGTKRYSREVRERAVRMVFEHEGRHGSRWETIRSIAGKLGCSTEALRNWVKQTEVDSGQKDGVTSEERVRVKELERENFELRRANEILRKASAYFAQAELDRRPK